MKFQFNHGTRAGRQTVPFFRYRVWIGIFLAAVLLTGLPLDTVSGEEIQGADASFSFIVAADQRSFTGPGQYDTLSYFRGAIEAARNVGAGAFMISPGDIDPPADSLWTIRSVLGESYPWYPVVGNHELPGQGEEAAPGANMEWLRNYDYGPVNPGPAGCPETTYSFDYGDAHFVVLNEFCSAKGDTQFDIPQVSDQLYNWLASDLAANTRQHVFVIGHGPAYVMPDADNGRVRHKGESLDANPQNRDRFWNLLRQEGVLMYIAGHTHNYSMEQVNGVWQLDAGHARGAGDPGADSTFIKINVNAGAVSFETYRTIADGGAYELRYSGLLTTGETELAFRLYLPFTAGDR